MIEQNQEVTVRQLPNGVVWPARRLGMEARVLRLELIADPSTPTQLHIGDPAEVQDSERLYLGEVLGLKDSTLLVKIEHFLEREDLLEIDRVWQPAEKTSP
jgi:hypothetical protein